MAFVRVEQRNAHLAGAVRLEFVNGRDGKVAKGTVTAISNTRRGSGEGREDEATAIEWTLCGKQAENAAEYLGKGSHVNIVGHLRNNDYQKDGEDAYALPFTVEEIGYLDSKASSEAREARRARQDRRTDRRRGQGPRRGVEAFAQPQAPQRIRCRRAGDGLTDQPGGSPLRRLYVRAAHLHPNPYRIAESSS